MFSPILWVHKYPWKADSRQYLCPGCAKERPCRRMRVSWFLTVGAFPLVRLRDTAEAYDECTVCDTRFQPDPRGVRSAGITVGPSREGVILAVLSGMLVEGDTDTEVVREEVGRSYQCLTGKELEEAELGRAVSRALADRESAVPIALASLPLALRELLLQRAQGVAAADGEVGPAERVYLNRVAEAMGLVP